MSLIIRMIQKTRDRTVGRGKAALTDRPIVHDHKIALRSGLAVLFLCALPLVGCRNHDFPEYPANYREFAYVTNGGSDTVSIFDIVNIRLDRELRVGQNPTGVAINPRRNEVYVVNTGRGERSKESPAGLAAASLATNRSNAMNGSISVIDVETNSVAATIPVGKQPYFVEVDPSGDWAYVANSGSNSVSILDLKQRRQIAVVGTGEGPGLARISPDGKTLLVTNRIGNSVSILDVGSHSQASPQLYVRKVIEGCPGATDAVILPDSSKAFVVCSNSHQVLVIALMRSDDGKTAGRPDALETMLDVGRSPVHLALKPDGGEIFVSNFDSDSISEIVTSTDDVSGSYLMGSHPVRGLVSDDNSLLYVSNFRSRELSVYSIDDGKRTAKPIHVGDGPDGLAFSASGQLLLAVDGRSGDLAVVRTSTSSLFTLLPTGRQPNAIAIKTFKMP